MMMSDESGFQVADDAPAAYEQHHRVFMTPLVEALLDRVEPGERSSVLDVACGTGFLSRAAAQRVGEKGRVAGVDVNEAMLAMAQDRAPRGAPTIGWHHASAQALPFEDATFDAVVSQQGIQFFPDLDAAVVEFARVAKPHGTVAVTAWTAIEDSPYFHAQLTAMTEMLGADAMAGMAEAFVPSGERIRDAFVAAGLSDVTMEVVAPEVTLPSITRYVAAQITATPWGPAFTAAGKDVRKRIIMRMSDMLIEDTIDGSPVVPFSSWLVAGTR